jgi:hypothetical protein
LGRISPSRASMLETWQLQKYQATSIASVSTGRAISMTTDRDDGLGCILQDSENAIASAKMIFSIMLVLPTL